MARDGEHPLARFARALGCDGGLSLGPPKLSADGATAVLPILRTSLRPRRFVVAEEASDAVSGVDAGRLDRITVRNDAACAVFLPPGAIFRSDATASRSTTAGVVVGPGSEAAIEVKCVHASQPLIAGTPLVLDRRFAPDAVRRALLSRDQGRVWAAVAAILEPSGAGSDDLVTAIAPELAAGSMVNDTPTDVRTRASECGVVVLNALGVVALEWYDSPESWKAVAPSVVPQHRDLAGPVDGSPSVAAIDPAAAVRAAQEFVAELALLPLRPSPPASWVSNDFSVGCTLADGDLIHLLAFRRDEPGGSRSMATHPGRSVHAAPIGAGPAFDWSAVPETGEAEVSASAMAMEGPPEDASASPTGGRPRRRKVLTSGWDDPTFGTLERYARKEFSGDRSAAMRFLVRQGLRTRGYFGPLPVSPPTAIEGAVSAWGAAPYPEERARAGIEVRLQDLERIAETPEYALWLRKRARLELEHMASSLEDDLLRAAAQGAVERLPPVEPEPAPEPPEPVEEEARPSPPLPTPVDVRPLLRQAFASSAGGDYRQAIALFDRILDEEAGNRTARLGRAVAFRRAGKSQEALDDLEVVLAAEPRNAAALLARGQLLQARGDLEGALASFDLLVAVAASDWDVWVARGDVLAKMGRNEDALQSYAEALRRNPDDPSLRARIRTVEAARVPVPPTTLPRPPVPPGVEEGQSYLVKESRHERTYALFRALAGPKVTSLVLTSRSRDLVRRELGLSSARIIGLSFSPGEDFHNPTALASLIRTIERFVYDNQGHGVILLDGLHDLIANNGFRETVLCIERIHEAILQSQAILIVSVAPEDLAEREAALLERNLRLLA